MWRLACLRGIALILHPSVTGTAAEPRSVGHRLHRRLRQQLAISARNFPYLSSLSLRHSFLSQAQGLLGCSAISLDPSPRVSLHFTLHFFFSVLLMVWNMFPAFILLAFNPSLGCIVSSEHWGLLSSDYGEIESVIYEFVL